MSVLTGVVAIGRRKTATILKTPHDSAPWFPAKGVGTIELSALGELLGVGRSTDLAERFELLGSASEEGPWLTRVPVALVDAVGDLTDSALKKVAAKWATIEEFKLGRRKTRDLVQYLAGLRDFVRANKGPFALFLSL